MHVIQQYIVKLISHDMLWENDKYMLIDTINDFV